jgi:hypothetical protein
MNNVRSDLHAQRHFFPLPQAGEVKKEARLIEDWLAEFPR